MSNLSLCRVFVTFLVVGLLLSVVGCISITTSESGSGPWFLTPGQKALVQNMEQALTVADVKSSFLFKSADIFYPDGIPEDPAHLPTLTDAQLHTLEKFVSKASDRVAQDARRYRVVLSEIYGRNLPDTHVRRIALEQGNPVEARVDADGTLYVSAKVIQAIYRGVLLVELQGDAKPPKDEASRQQAEEAALKQFEELRTRIKSMSPVTPVNEVEHAVGGSTQTSGGLGDQVLSALDNMLSGELEDWLSTQFSEQLSAAFFDTMVFVAGHELGHLELGHLPLEPGVDICAEIGQHETEADRFSAILLALDQYGDETYSYTFDGKTTTFNASPAKYVTTGFWPFFTYAYGMAGFDDLRRPGDCLPLNASDRNTKTMAQYAMAAFVLNDATNDNALYGTWWQRLFGLEVGGGITTDREVEFEKTYRALQTPPEDGKVAFSPEELSTAKSELKDLFLFKFGP